jgi:hypothetical protein
MSQYFKHNFNMRTNGHIIYSSMKFHEIPFMILEVFDTCGKTLVS